MQLKNTRYEIIKKKMNNKVFNGGLINKQNNIGKMNIIQKKKYFCKPQCYYYIVVNFTNPNDVTIKNIQNMIVSVNGNIQLDNIG